MGEAIGAPKAHRWLADFVGAGAAQPKPLTSRGLKLCGVARWVKDKKDGKVAQYSKSLSIIIIFSRFAEAMLPRHVVKKQTNLQDKIRTQ